jgi:hypothetical protein
VDSSVLQHESRERALSHARELVNAWERYRSEKTPLNMADVEQRAEALFAFLLAAFEGEVTQEQVRELVSMNRDYLSRNVLDDVPDAFVPLAIVRTVIVKHRVMFSPHKTQHWKHFNTRYGRFITAA